MKIKTTPIPRTLSALLREALDDCYAVERAAAVGEAVAFNMSSFIRGPDATISHKCEVCLAGAMLYARGGRSGDSYNGLTWHERLPVYAVDSIRRGALGSSDTHQEFLSRLTTAQRRAVKRADLLVESEFNPENGRAPWSTYEQVVRIYQEAGL